LPGKFTKSGAVLENKTHAPSGEYTGPNDAPFALAVEASAVREINSTVAVVAAMAFAAQLAATTALSKLLIMILPFWFFVDAVGSVRNFGTFGAYSVPFPGKSPASKSHKKSRRKLRRPC
jgi:hypothetical protein